MLSPTPLVHFPAAGPEIYGKIEYLHPSGSMKHRAIPAFLEYLVATVELEKGRAIIVHSAGAAAVTTAWAGLRIGCPVIAVIPPFATEETVRQLKWLNAEVHQVMPQEAAAHIQNLAEKNNYFVLKQTTETRILQYYETVGEEIMAQLPNCAAVVVGIGTGLSVTGIQRGIAKIRPEVKVFGIEPSEAPVASTGEWKPHRVPGLAPPIKQPLLNKAALADILLESSEQAWHWAKKIGCEDGFLIGPSSGITVAGAVSLRKLGVKGPIVAICACSMDAYYSMTTT